MLFNSYSFLFVFLPIAIAFILIVQRTERRELSFAVMLGLSAVFYCYSSVQFFGLLLVSVATNHVLSASVAGNKRLLASGIAFNLLLLGVLKYAGFFTIQAQALGLPIPVVQFGLPLAISFYTFKQISYLVDVHGGKVQRPPLSEYAAYVTFFPHLIAGPIVRYWEVAGRFNRPMPFRVTTTGLRLGLIFIGFGLAKKVWLADRFAINANAGFQNVDGLTLLDAWISLLAFTLQIYFDFSGYSDIAIGLALIFSIRLPDNFNSPYRALDVSSFWRRWHISLSRFLRDYLYVPLGGNRRGNGRTAFNLLVVMALGGLWHGANWTFLVWGVLHGFYLAVFRLWSAWSPIRLPGPLSWALTFGAVVVAWVFFRAQSLEQAISFLGRLADIGNFQLPPRLEPLLAGLPLFRSVRFGPLITGSLIDLLALAIGLAIVLAMPTTKRLVIHSRGRARWLALAGGLTGIATVLLLEAPSVFIYFNF
jgi:alginate O-acetyltransferase complex protein AlgI